MFSLAQAVVLVTLRSFGRHDASLRRDLESAVGAVRYNELGRAFTTQELCDRVGDVDGIIAGLDPFDDQVLEAASRLRVVARYGVGTSNVDLGAAARIGIVVTNTPGANAESVAELAIGLIFCLARSIPRLDREIRNHLWPSLGGVEVRGKVVGIVGLGQVGRATARRAAALGCRVLAYDPIPAACVAAPEGVRAAPLEEVIAESHFLSLHLPVTEQTRLLVDEAWLALMRPGAYLVNTARGELLDEAAVLKALQDGRLAGVALDALTQEPPPDDHPFLRRPDVILTGHSGAHTHDAAAAMGRAALSDVLAVLSGQTPRYPVSMPAAG